MKSWKMKNMNSLNVVSFQCTFLHLHVFYTVICGTMLFKCTTLSCHNLPYFVSKILRRTTKLADCKIKSVKRYRTFN